VFRLFKMSIPFSTKRLTLYRTGGKGFRFFVDDRHGFSENLISSPSTH
jgi:hypothetical protein